MQSGNTAAVTAAKRVTSLLLSLLLVACTSSPPPVQNLPVVSPVGTVDLIQATGESESAAQLEVGISVFSVEQRSPDASELGDWIFSEITHNEAHYLPYVLRNTLVASGQWGAVRVLPEDDPSVDLVINGTILQSDGQNLTLHILARDSSGQIWLDQHYADLSKESDYPESTRFTAANRFDPLNHVDPFQDIHDQISNDLLLKLNQLSIEELRNLKHVTALVYASDLAAVAFGHMLRPGPAGLEVVSLPAVDDPMWRRVDEMKLRHQLFIDTVDEYYRALYEDMQISYLIWRRYSFDQIQQELALRSDTQDAQGYGRSNSYLSLTQRYDRYRWSKIYEQEFTALASGFNREMAPAILELNRRVHGLSGTMEDQYRQWRSILRRLFELETQ